jgi:hypothetical protein
MKKSLFLKTLTVTTFMLLGINTISAQCTISGLNSNYCTTSASSTLTPGLTGGTFSGPGIVGSVFSPSLAGPGTHTINYSICSTSYAISSESFAPTSTVGTCVTLSDDSESSALPIGFTFQYFCTNYTTFNISSNGFIEFGATGSGCCAGQSLPNTTAPNNLIAYSWTDMNPQSVCSVFTYSTFGSSPTRTLVVSANGLYHYSPSSTLPVTAQIKLMETTNIIEIHTTTKPINSSYATTMGIENSGGTIGYAVTGRNATSTWSATNECYRWSPGATCSISQTTNVSPSTISVVGNNSICLGSTSSLTATGNTTYTWSTSSNSNSITVSPTTNTTYSVSGTNSFGCVASSAITITVDLTPTVTANSSNGTSGACPGRTVSLSGSGATSYTWTGGITNGAAFTPTSTNSYTVSGGNSCGISSSAITVSVHPLPTVGGVASSASVCSGVSATLSGVGTATNYVWSGGAGGITNGVGFFPSTSATYTVIGTSALSCTATANVPIAVVTTPSVSPTSNPPTICLGKSSTLTATGATNYTWLPGNASTASIAVSPTAVINTYTVIRSNANCVTTQTLNVFVNQLPNIFGIATPTLVCAGKPSTLAVGGALTYTWTGQTPSYTFTGASPVVSPPVTNVYTVVGTDNNGCQNSATVMVATDPNPTITIAASSTVLCRGQSVTLTASGGINYTWTSTSGTVNTATYSDTPLGPTLYNVTADNSFSCTSTISQVILVNPTPTINIAVTKTLVCTTGPSTLTATGANTYVWDANANNAVTPGTIVNPVATTVYTVQGTFTATGCQSTRTTQVTVFTPTITVTSPTNTCYGGNITLVASGANPNTYNWNTGSGFTNPFQTIAVTPTVFTIYTVSAISGSNGVNCPSTQTTSIGIFYNPTITATPQRTLFCRFESIELYGNGGVSYSWSNAQTGGTITVSPQTNTNYTVTGTDANGCVNTGTIQVKVSSCVGINELDGTATTGLSVYPNPNNGSFTVSSDINLKLNLVNELGQMVRTIELKASNNYKADISELAKGIYFIVGEKEGLQFSQKIIVTE